MSSVNSALLAATPILDYTSAELDALVIARGWRDLPERERIGAVYASVPNDVTDEMFADMRRHWSESHEEAPNEEIRATSRHWSGGDVKREHNLSVCNY